MCMLKWPKCSPSSENLRELIHSLEVSMTAFQINQTHAFQRIKHSRSDYSASTLDYVQYNIGNI